MCTGNLGYKDGYVDRTLTSCINVGLTSGIIKPGSAGDVLECYCTASPSPVDMESSSVQKIGILDAAKVKVVFDRDIYVAKVAEESENERCVCELGDSTVIVS